MLNYVEMIQLFEAGFNLRQIDKLVSAGRNTVTRTIDIAKEKELTYEKVSNWSTEDFVLAFKPQKDTDEPITSYYVMPETINCSQKS